MALSIEQELNRMEIPTLPNPIVADDESLARLGAARQKVGGCGQRMPSAPY